MKELIKMKAFNSKTGKVMLKKDIPYQWSTNDTQKYLENYTKENRYKFLRLRPDKLQFKYPDMEAYFVDFPIDLFNIGDIIVDKTKLKDTSHPDGKVIAIEGDHIIYKALDITGGMYGEPIEKREDELEFAELFYPTTISTDDEDDYFPF